MNPATDPTRLSSPHPPSFQLADGDRLGIESAIASVTEAKVRQGFGAEGMARDDSVAVASDVLFDVIGNEGSVPAAIVKLLAFYRSLQNLGELFDVR